MSPETVEPTEEGKWFSNCPTATEQMRHVQGTPMQQQQQQQHKHIPIELGSQQFPHIPHGVQEGIHGIGPMPSPPHDGLLGGAQP